MNQDNLCCWFGSHFEVCSAGEGGFALAWVVESVAGVVVVGFAYAGFMDLGSEVN